MSEVSSKNFFGILLLSDVHLKLFFIFFTFINIYKYVKVDNLVRKTTTNLSVIYK